ncbi:MAG: hypothetical protein ACFFEK_16210, partial [Candidatus Thorarchaeota archaeon]
PKSDGSGGSPPKSFPNGGSDLSCGLLFVIPVVITLLFLYPLQPLLLTVASDSNTFIFFFFGLVIVFGAIFGTFWYLNDK